METFGRWWPRGRYIVAKELRIQNSSTGHFVHTGPFIIFALFTRNFEWEGILIFIRLRWFRENARNFNGSKIRPVPCQRQTGYYTANGLQR